MFVTIKSADGGTSIGRGDETDYAEPLQMTERRETGTPVRWRVEGGVVADDGISFDAGVQNAREV